MLFGAVETGGTKIICAILDEEGQLLDSLRFPTDNPDKIIVNIAEYFKQRDIASLGIGSFGPVDINTDSPTYGYILDTPKPGWRNYPFLPKLKEKLNIPMVIDTDVNCACLGEMMYGSTKGINTMIYITIGTGIGVGVVVGKTTLKGMLHPEAGHILMRRNPADSYEGKCPYHKDCFEGLASGPAINERCKVPAYEIPADDSVWELEADYIAQAVTNYILAYSPEKVVLGGGVMEQIHLFPMIRERVAKYMNGYITTKQICDIDNYIVPATLNGKQGIFGAYYLAKQAI